MLWISASTISYSARNEVIAWTFSGVPSASQAVRLALSSSLVFV